MSAAHPDYASPAPEQPPPLQVAPLLATLERYSVEYVVIGGVAAQLHGDAHATYGLDITPNPYPPNLEQLRAALVDLDAREYVPGFGHPLQLPMSRRRLSTDVPLLTSTRHGPLDVIPKPHGFDDGYVQVGRRMRHVHAYGLMVPTAHRVDLIQSHIAAGRAKDEAIVARLRELDDRISQHGMLPPHEQPRDIKAQTPATEPEIHAALDAASALATVFDDIRPALAAARRQLYGALDEAQYGDPTLAARRIDIARKAVDTAQTHITAVRRELQPDATPADLEHPPVLLGQANSPTVLAYQAYEEIRVTRQLLGELEPHRLHTIDAHDTLIEARIHAATGDANLDLLQIQLERAARAWEIPDRDELSGPDL